MSVDAIIRTMEVDELLELDRQLQGLRSMPGWDRLQEFVQEHRDAKVRALTLKVYDHATYAHMAGAVAGLDTPSVVIDEVHAWADRVRREMVERSQGDERDGD